MNFDLYTYSLDSLKDEQQGNDKACNSTLVQTIMLSFLR